ncbi:MAG: leucine-rich repeat protein, partial [Firmicutes bacterium]|nr:leucine-rich repeat protein [Bacillota bacterium]
DRGAFLGMNKLKNISLPESVTIIGAEAFKNCISLESIVIPKYVNKICDNAFSGCSKLERAMFAGDAPEITGVGTYDTEQIFKNCYVDFEINYLNGKTGWTEPEWNGYPCKGVDAFEEEEETFVYGGANNTGRLEAADSAVILQKVLNGSYKMPIENETSDYLKYVDVDCDGKITASDSTTVLQKVLNSSFKMPVEE